MADPTFPEQVRELRTLLERSHLSEGELARRAHLKEETFRKYLGGYQRCGKSAMVSIRTVAQMEIERMDRAIAKQPGQPTLQEEAVRYAVKLLELPADKRDLAKKLIDQLHGKPNCGPIESAGVGILGKAAKAVAGSSQHSVSDKRSALEDQPADSAGRGKAKGTTSGVPHQGQGS